MKEQILIYAFCEEFSSFQIVAFIFNDLFLFMTVLQSILNLFDPFFIFFFSSFTNGSVLFTLSGANTLLSFFFFPERMVYIKNITVV